MTNNRIVTNLRIANGTPTIRGTQVPVHKILTKLAAGISPNEILTQLDGLELADVNAALEYAAGTLQKQTKPNRGTEPLNRDTVTSHESSDLDLKKILVVDDLEENRVLMKHMFKGSGFNLIMAANARQALAKAREELPVLVISDIQMPNMSGFDLLTALRSDERTKNMGVILVTAHARGSRHASHGLAMGADDYIYRPFMRNEFLSRVGTIVRVKWTEEETRRQSQAIARHNKGLEVVNELALAVNSSLDLQEIFVSSMQKLSQLLEAEAVSLLLVDDEKQLLEVNISSQYAGKHVSTTIDFKLDTESTSRFIEEQVPNVVTSILNNSFRELGIASIPGFDNIECIPMVSKEHIIGAIAIISKHKNSFTDTDWVLLNSAVGIIAVAVENASLLQATQAQIDDLIVLNEIGRALTSSLDQDQILKQTTLLVQRSLQAEVASLWLLDEAGTDLILIATSGVGAGVADGFRLPVDHGLAGYVARTGEPYISADAFEDKRFFQQVSETINYQPRSILSVPVRIKGHIIGVMQALHRSKGWFDENHQRLFHSVASSVGIAVENARLFAEVQDFNRHLGQMVEERTRALAEEQEKTEAILTSMADGLLVLDAENFILTANAVAEEMLEFQLDKLLGQPISVEQLEDPMWRCISNMAVSTDLTDSALVDLHNGQNEVRSLQARSAKLRDESDKIIGTVVVLRDITALKEVERIKARFMAGVTHELKTPLSVIRLHSKNLLAYFDRLPAQKKQDLLNSIQSQVELLEKLIEDILQLSRLDSGVAESERLPLNLIEVIDQVVTDLNPLAEDREIAIRWVKSKDNITIEGNPNQLDRVVRNLIENAIKYTPSRGSVDVQTISQSIDGQTFTGVQITDTGIGIPREQKSRIFDRFYRVDSSHTIPGTGLGLSIVREIVSAHGGDISVESKVGEGSTFVVTLPYVENMPV